MNLSQYLHLLILVTAISGCATAPLAERALGQSFPIAPDATGEDVAQVTFSADKKYESLKGVPLQGDPLICGRDGVFRINATDNKEDKVLVTPGKEIAVTSVIRWVNTGWQKTCWPFVAFTPEPHANYVVVNERLGGKGASALWTGVARQSCQVVVYRVTPTGIERVATKNSSLSACRSNDH